jgi:hypothetical protein
LNEDGVITVKWMIPTEENSLDLYTKNLPGPTFEKHASVHVEVGEYMAISETPKDSTDSREEGVSGDV